MDGTVQSSSGRRSVAQGSLRRSILMSRLVAVALVGIVSVLSSFPARGADLRAPGAESWPSFRNGNLQTGVATTKLPASLEKLWTFPAGDSVSMIKCTA